VTRIGIATPYRSHRSQGRLPGRPGRRRRSKASSA